MALLRAYDASGDSEKKHESALLICVRKKVHGLIQDARLLLEVFSWPRHNHTVNQANQNTELGHVSGWLKMVLIKLSIAFISVVKMKNFISNKQLFCHALEVEKYEGNHKLYNYRKASTTNRIAWLKNICDHMQHGWI